MTDNKFDLGKFLAGVDRPEEEVLLYWNVKLAKEIEELANRQEDLKVSENERDTAGEKKASLIQERDRTAIRVTLRGVPRDVLKSIDQKVSIEHPVTEGFGETEALVREDARSRMKLLSYAERVIDPNGVEQSPVSEDTVDALMDMLHPMEFRKLLDKMEYLENLSLGYEQKATDPLFT